MSGTTVDLISSSSLSSSFLPMWDDQFLWITVLGFLFCLYMAWGIGANDVANAFGTSVGSGALSYRAAVVCAGFCEFGGAVLMGSHVAGTIKDDIIQLDLFRSAPVLLLLGFLSALLSAAIWLSLASRLGLPVSTTHSIIGAVIGFAILEQGGEAVDWTGVGKIVLSWVISPLLSGLVAAGLFFVIRLLVLRPDRRRGKVRFGYYLSPAFFGLTAGTIAVFVIYKGSPQLELSDALTVGEAVGIGLGIAVVVGAISIFAFNWQFKKWEVRTAKANPRPSCLRYSFACCCCRFPSFEEEENLDEAQLESGSEALKSVEQEGEEATTSSSYSSHSPADEPESEEGDVADDDDDDEEKSSKSTPKSNQPTQPNANNPNRPSLLRRLVARVVRFFSAGRDEASLQQLHDTAERFSVESEEMFSLLQVFTACIDSFAHGANDTANAVAPIAAIYAINSAGGEISAKSEVPLWILAIGGAGIVLGLLTYGWRVIQTLGSHVTLMTPSRGFSAEYASTLTVLVASRLGLPVSTTHCQTGAVAGVGLIDGRKAVNWRLILLICLSWIFTLPLAGLTSAFLYTFFRGALAIQDPELNPPYNNTDYF